MRSQTAHNLSVPATLGAFGTSTHDRCKNPGCKGMTTHQSGECEQCRTFKCERCGVLFVASKPVSLRDVRCCQCRRIKGTR